MTPAKKPCPACPFSGTCEPGALGGSAPSAYIGQVLGPFALPCHAHCDFDDPDWRAKAGEVAQCAGAAVFRGHLGLAGRLPAAIPILPANPTVFADPYEFLTHHLGISREEAKMRFSLETFLEWRDEQLLKALKGEKP